MIIRNTPKLYWYSLLLYNYHSNQYFWYNAIFYG